MERRKAWFCYEFVHGDRPTPVVYHGELPENDEPRQQITDISHLFTKDSCVFDLLSLMRQYPYVKVLQKGTSDATTKQQEKQMTRPVSGFQTKQGAFFEEEKDADLYEAAYDLEMALTEAVVEFVPDETHFAESLVAGITAFITNNKEIVRKFIDARAASVTIKETANVQVDGPAAEANPSHDTPVWDEDNTRLDAPETPEALSAPVGTDTDMQF